VHLFKQQQSVRSAGANIKAGRFSRQLFYVGQPFGMSLLLGYGSRLIALNQNAREKPGAILRVWIKFNLSIQIFLCSGLSRMIKVSTLRVRKGKRLLLCEGF